MKKWLTALCTCIFLVSDLSALPVGNPSEPNFSKDGLFFVRDCIVNTCCDPGPKWWYALSFRLGFYGDYVFNRHLESEGDDISQIDRARIWTNAGQLILNIFDRCDLFWNLGNTQLVLQSIVDPTGSLFVLETGQAFSWSLGGRVLAFQCGCWRLGGELQYVQSHARIDRLTLAEATSIYPATADELHYQEWQAGIALSYTVRYLVPYIGAKYAHAKISFPHSTLGPFTFDPLRSANHLGMCVGASFTGWRSVSLTAEGRFGDERALFVNAQARF